MVDARRLMGMLAAEARGGICTGGRRIVASPPADQTREITPLPLGAPRRGTGSGYLGCCCSTFGLAASCARFAIHASYSGVPRRGGAPSGRPPIQCGMSAICSPAVRPLPHDDRQTHTRHRKADLILAPPLPLPRLRLTPPPSVPL